jgi:predicted CopG family antitoxin
MTTVSINDEMYNGIKLEAEKQHRSISSLIEWIILRSKDPIVRKISDQELEKALKKLEVVV